MNIYGQTVVGAPVELAADTKMVGRYTAPLPSYLGKISVYMDGLGSGVGAQLVRGVAYTVAGALYGVSNEVLIPDGFQPGWVDFTFPLPLPIAAGDVNLGVFAGAAGSSARVYAVSPDGAGGSSRADTYSDGPTDPYGSPTPIVGRLSLFATFTKVWEPPAADDFFTARLPFSESQQAFLSGPDPAAVFQTGCGWYGTSLDPEKGAFALVQQGSPLEAVVGKRVRLTRSDSPKAQVFCFVHSFHPDLLEEICVPRLVFARLGGLAADRVKVRVEVVDPIDAQATASFAEFVQPVAPIDPVVRIAISLVDTGLVVADSLRAPHHLVKLVDTGLVVSDSFNLQRRTLTDTGLSITDSIASSRARGLTDTGLVIADSIGALFPSLSLIPRVTLFPRSL